MAFVVDGDAVLGWLTKCGIEPPNGLSRVVIDMEVGKVAKLYFDSFPNQNIMFDGVDLSNSEIVNGNGSGDK